MAKVVGVREARLLESMKKEKKRRGWVCDCILCLGSGTEQSCFKQTNIPWRRRDRVEKNPKETEHDTCQSPTAFSIFPSDYHLRIWILEIALKSHERQ